MILKACFLNVDLNDNNVSAVTDKIWWGRLLAGANEEYKERQLSVHDPVLLPIISPWFQ